MARRETFAVEDCLDAARRKQIFRSHAGDLIRAVRGRYTTDAPGDVAKLMEDAFRAGLSIGQSQGGFDPSQRVGSMRITLKDVPRLSQDIFKIAHIHLGLHRGGKVTRELLDAVESSHMIVFKTEGIALQDYRVTADSWNYWTGTYGNKIMSPLFKMGLFHEPRHVDGRVISALTEWGFELLLTGSTNGPDDRMPGASTLYEHYRRVCHRGDKAVALLRAGGLLP